MSSVLRELLERFSFISFTQSLGDPDPSAHLEAIREVASQDASFAAFASSREQLSSGGPETLLTLALSQPEGSPLYEQASALVQEGFWEKPLLSPLWRPPAPSSGRRSFWPFSQKKSVPRLDASAQDSHSDRVSGFGRLSGGALLSSSWDASFKRWELAEGRCTKTWQGYVEITSFTVHPTRSLLFFTGSDAALWSWNLDSGLGPKRFSYHHKRPLSALCPPDGEHVLSSSDDLTLKLWEIDSGACVQSLEGHKGGVIEAALLSKDRVLSLSRDHTVKLWELSSGACLQTYSFGQDQLLRFCVHPDGKRVFIGSQERSLRFFDLEQGDDLYKLPSVGAPVSAMSLSSDGRLLAATFHDKTLRIFDIQQGEFITRFSAQEPLTACSFIDDKILCGDAHGRLYLFRLLPGAATLL